MEDIDDNDNINTPQPQQQKGQRKQPKQQPPPPSTAYTLRRSKRLQTLVSNEETLKKRKTTTLNPLPSLPLPSHPQDQTITTTTPPDIAKTKEITDDNNHTQPHNNNNNNNNNHNSIDNNDNNKNNNSNSDNNKDHHDDSQPQRSETLVIPLSTTISPTSTNLTKEETTDLDDISIPPPFTITPKALRHLQRRINKTNKSINTKTKSLSDDLSSLKSSNASISSYIYHEDTQNNSHNITHQNQSVLTENLSESDSDSEDDSDNDSHCIIIFPSHDGVCSPSLYTDDTYISISNAPTPIIEDHNSDEETTVDNNPSTTSLLTEDNAGSEIKCILTSQQHPTPIQAPSSPSITPVIRRKRRLKPEISSTVAEMGVLSFKGTRADNQDSYSYYTDRFPYILTICDGHGCKGREAATEAAKKIQSRIRQDTTMMPLSIRTPPRMSEIIHNSYEDAHTTVLHDKLDYGTTVCSVVINENQMISSWAGDSRVYLFTRRESVELKDCEGEPLLKKTWEDVETGESDVFFDQIRITGNDVLPPLTLVQLSTDHNPLRPDEKSRVESCRGRVLPRKDNNTTPKKEKNPPTLPKIENPEFPNSSGSTFPPRVPGSSNYRVLPAAEDFNDIQIKQKALALNISRSLGHTVLKNYGVSFVPEFSVVTLAHHDIVLLCSDGLWNEINNNDLGVLIQNHFNEDPQKICSIITKEAENRSKLRKNCDNVTTLIYRHNYVNSDNNSQSSNNDNNNHNNNNSDSIPSNSPNQNAHSSDNSLPSSSSTTPATIFTSLIG